MAPLTSLRRGNRDGPQAEDLKDPKALNPTVSPRFLDSYTFKRPDDVAKPHNAGAGWEQLSHALGRLNPVLDRMAAASEQKFFEEETATGQKLMEENKVAWEELVKNKPQYAGLNPHLERGYKAAYLASKSQDLKAFMDEKYTTGGFVNETDPEKVRAAADGWAKEYIQKNINTANYDPDILVENFLKPAQAVKGALLTRNTNDRAAEHIKRGEESLGLCASTTVQAALNQPGSSDPAVWDTIVKTQLAPTLMAQMDQLEKSGMPRSRIHATMSETLINISRAEGVDGRGESILALADNMKVGTGTIGGKPEFKAKAGILRDHWKAEERQNEIQRRQLAREQREDAARQAKIGIAGDFLDARKNNKPLPTVDFLVDKYGKQHLPEIATMQSVYAAAATYRPPNDLPAQVRHAQLKLDASMGRLSPEEALSPEIVSEIGYDAAAKLAEDATKGRDKNDPISLVRSSPEVAEGVKNIEHTLDLGTTERTSPQAKARIIEAQQALVDAMVEHSREAEAKKQRLTPERTRTLAREEYAKIIKDPSFKVYGSSTSEIRGSKEIKAAAGSRDYWLKTERSYFPTQKDAIHMTWLFIRNRPAAEKALSATYGIPADMAEAFVARQAVLSRLDYPAMVQKNNEVKAYTEAQYASPAEKDRLDRRDALVKTFAGSPSVSSIPIGMVRPGNINLNNRPVVKNANGSVSTVLSKSFGFDGREVLIPCVSDDGRILSDDEAKELYKRTGKHLGIFDTPEHATAYADDLHNQQERQYVGTQQQQDN